MDKIYIIFQLVCVYSTFVYSRIKTKPEGKLLETNPGCIHALQVDLPVLNERLTTCQIPKSTMPIANTEKYVKIKCEHMKDLMKCFRRTYESFKECLETSVGHKYYTDQLHQYNAGRVHLCENNRKQFIEFKKNGEECVASKNKSLSECERLQFEEKWIDLLTIDFPPEQQTLVKPKQGPSNKECRLKGIWLMCVLGKLESCKSAWNYYKGYYGSMLAASKCDSIIRKEFPTLAYAGTVPGESNAAICRLDLNVFLIALSVFTMAM